jgi:hypothetical protein
MLDRYAGESSLFAKYQDCFPALKGQNATGV